jgi:hypothetical protein
MIQYDSNIDSCNANSQEIGEADKKYFNPIKTGSGRAEKGGKKKD